MSKRTFRDAPSKESKELYFPGPSSWVEQFTFMYSIITHDFPLSMGGPMKVPRLNHRRDSKEMPSLRLAKFDPRWDVRSGSFTWTWPSTEYVRIDSNDYRKGNIFPESSSLKRTLGVARQGRANSYRSLKPYFQKSSNLERHLSGFNKRHNSI